MYFNNKRGGFFTRPFLGVLKLAEALEVWPETPILPKPSFS